MKRVFITALLLCTVAAVAIADGPETGLVSGKVTDAQGTPLPGVTVTLEGERGSQAAITDENGVYRFPLLVPGSYVVRAELEGFHATQAPVTVRAGGKADAELKLTLGTAEEITVTSEAPMVDKFNVTAGATLTAEVGTQAAGENRTYYGVINMLPGVSSDSENQDIQGTRPNVNGGHFADSGVFIDGVDTTFARFGGSRVFLPTTATTEITMEAGGSSAEYGRFVASTTNVIVKSGTNQFHGAVAGSYQDTQWAGDFKDQPLLTTSREFSPAPPDFLRRLPEEEDTDATGYEFSFGGPIKRDKAWFFLGWADFSTNDLDKTLNQDLVDTSLESESRIVKLNFQPSPRHSLSGSYIDTPAFRVYFHPPSGDQYTPTPHDVPGTLGSVNWNFSISSDLFLETKLAVQTSDENKFLAVGVQNICSSCPIEEVYADALAIKQQDPRFPPNPAMGPHWPGNNYSVYVDDRDDDSWHNGWLLDNGFGTNEYPRDQANAALTWFASEHHELKFGFDYQEVEWKSNVRKVNLYSGPNFNALSPSGYDDCGIVRGIICFYADYNPPDLLAQGNANSSLNETAALFVRDRFTVGDHWIFNIGLRVEDMNNKNDIGRTVVDETVLSPRFSGTYDVKADGRMLFNLNVGRYYAQLNQQLTNQWLQEKWTGYYGQDNFLWCDGLDVLVQTVLAPGVLPGCETQGYNFQIARRRPGQMWDMVDAGLYQNEIEPYHKDEIILGFEWQFTRNWAFDAKAIHWELDNMIGATIQRGPNGEIFELAANYKNYPEILRAIGVVPEENIAQFREGIKEYDALQLQVNKRFSNGWALYNNITLAETDTTGSGAWWNNWVSTYGYLLDVSLTQNHIEICKNSQAGFDSAINPATGQIVRGGQRSDGRVVPIDCQALLGPHIGTPVSLINRRGEDGVGSTRYDEGGSGADRPVILKSFGFKQWELGKHTFNLGGMAVWQEGISWGRVEEIPNTLLGSSDPTDPFNLTGGTNGLDMVAEPVGTRRLDSHWWINMTAAWGFPLSSRLAGELRTEVINVTDNQDQIGILDKGEVRRVRRDFQRPRQVRVLATLRF